MNIILRSVVLVACLSASCGPAPQSTEVSRVGAAELVNHVRDYGDKAYRGQRVQVRVPPRSYAVEGDCIHYYTGLPRTKPVIVFTCFAPQPPGAEAMLIVSGTCRGSAQDGIRKGDRITFVIYVDGCHVTRLE